MLLTYKKYCKLIAVCAAFALIVLGCCGCTDQDASEMKETVKDISEEISEHMGKLKSTEDIGLHDVDGYETNYSFTYDGEEFTAQYTPNNWRVYDSYRITNGDDIRIICQALLDEHTVNGQDMESIRTAKDMAYEWQQHNIAYAVLPEDNVWREHAKDVDLDPADQGRSFEEIYEDRTGEQIDLDDFDLGDLDLGDLDLGDIDLEKLLDR